MPIYRYRCPRCETVEDVFRNLSEMEKALFCNDCSNTLMEQIVTCPATTTKESISNPARMPKYPMPRWY